MTPEKNYSVESSLKTIAKNAGIAGGGGVIGQVFGSLIGVITTRALGAELYGIYMLATYWTGILAEFSRFGFGGDTLIRFIGAYKGEGRLDKVKGAIILTLKLAAIVGSALTLGMLLFAEPFCFFIISRPDAAPAFRFFSCAILFTAVSGCLNAALAGFQQQRYVVLTNAIVANLVKLGTLIILLQLGATLYAALASSLLQDVVIVTLGCFFLLKVFPEWRNHTLRPVTESKKLWKFSSTLFANTLFNKYTFQLDLLFLGMFRPVTEVGLYAVALRIQPLIYMPHYAIAQIFSPIVAELYARKNLDELSTIYKAVTKWTAVFSLPIFVIVVLFHQPLLSIFGSDFDSAAIALIVLGVGNLIADIIGLSGQIIAMIGKPGMNLVNSIITSILSITLFLFLIPKYGMFGAALAYSTSLVFINGLRLIEVHRFVGIHPFGRTVWKVFAAAAASAAWILWVRSFPPFQVVPWIWLPELASFVIIYIIVLFALKLDETDSIVINAIRRRFHRNKAKNDTH